MCHELCTHDTESVLQRTIQEALVVVNIIFPCWTVMYMQICIPYDIASFSSEKLLCPCLVSIPSPQCFSFCLISCEGEGLNGI